MKYKRQAFYKNFCLAPVGAIPHQIPNTQENKKTKFLKIQQNCDTKKNIVTQIQKWQKQWWDKYW